MISRGDWLSWSMVHPHTDGRKLSLGMRDAAEAEMFGVEVANMGQGWI